VYARHWDNDTKVEVASVLSSSSEYGDSNYFVWTANVPASALPSRQWRPTFLGPAPFSGLGGAFNAMGRLELSGTQRGEPLLTFTDAQEDCVEARLAAGDGVQEAGQGCSDYQTLVRFDVTGWNQAPLSGGLTIQSQKSDVTAWSPEGTSPVRVQLVSYASSGASNVHAMICSPPDASRHPLMIYNHGGALGTSTWDANMCLNVARRGWTMAMTAYRGEPLRIPSEWGMRYGIDISGGFVPLYLPSNGRIELNLGEVMDVLRLLQLLQDTHTSVIPDRVFMWGASHGGGVTLRAVQSGAKVQAAAALAPAGNWADIVRDCQARWDACPVPVTEACMPAADACRIVLFGGASADTFASVAPTASIIGGTPPTPPPTGVNNILRSYDWRSPNFFAQDLAYRRDVTLLIQHGVTDNIVRVNQSCKLAVGSFEDFLPTNAWHRTVSGGLTTASVAGCSGVTFMGAGAPDSDWAAGEPHLVVYDGIGHETILAPVMFGDLFNFQTWLESSWGI
jgi:dienelactone hydrolase